MVLDGFISCISTVFKAMPQSAMSSDMAALSFALYGHAMKVHRLNSSHPLLNGATSVLMFVWRLRNFLPRKRFSGDTMFMYATALVIITALSFVITLRRDIEDDILVDFEGNRINVGYDKIQAKF